MGALAQVQAQKLTFSNESPLGRWLQSEINRLGGGGGVLTNAAATSSVHSLADSSQTSGNMTLKFGIRQADGTIQEFTTASIPWNRVSGVGVEAVHVLATDATDHTGGDFTLTFLLKNGETFTIAAAGFDVSAAALETLIDTAATGVVTGWTNGDITVTASTTDLQDGTLTLTFDGTSVSNEPSHVLTTMVDSRTGGVSPATLISNTTVCLQTAIDLAAVAASITGFIEGDIVVTGTSVNTGPLTFTYVDKLQHNVPVLVDVDGAGGSWGATSITTAGQEERAALAVLLNYGIITGSVPVQDAANSRGSGFTRGNPALNRMPAAIVKALMAEAAAEDSNNSTYHAIEEALYGRGNDRANAVEPRVSTDE